MGLVHIYCGDGKGKTSAAIGLAVRAAGSGRRVVIARFLKTDNSGKVSCTYLGCDGCRDGLERSHLAFFVLFTVHAEMPEYLTDALPELSDLDES